MKLVLCSRVQVIFTVHRIMCVQSLCIRRVVEAVERRRRFGFSLPLLNWHVKAGRVLVY